MRPFRTASIGDPDDYKYLFIRTRLAIDLEGPALEALSEEIRYTAAQLFLFSDPGAPEGLPFTWEGGLAIRFAGDRTCAEIASDLADVLAPFDSWAIHDCRSEWVEHPRGGPLSRYFESPGRTGERSAMIFLADRDGEQRADDLASQVRDRLSATKCAPVFYFRGGRVLMFPDADPYRVLFNRVGSLADRFDGFAGCDQAGTFFNRGAPSVWEWTDIEEGSLAFTQ